MPADVKLIAYMPPQHRSALPPPGSEKHVRFVGCKHELAQRVRARNGGVLLDFFRDTPESRDAENFMDSGHYRAPMARHIEREIAAALAK